MVWIFNALECLICKYLVVNWWEMTSGATWLLGAKSQCHYIILPSPIMIPSIYCSMPQTSYVVYEYTCVYRSHDPIWYCLLGHSVYVRHIHDNIVPLVQYINIFCVGSDFLQVVPGHLKLCITAVIMHSLHHAHSLLWRPLC